MSAVSLGEFFDVVGGDFAGPRKALFESAAPLASASERQLAFLSNRKYAAELAASKAGAILVPKKLQGNDPRWIRVDDPYFAFAKIMTRWFSDRPKPTGISPKAIVADSARLGKN